MPITEDILKELKCCLASDFHYVIEPVLMECGANACKECVTQAITEKIQCYSCYSEHEKNFKLTVNKLAERVINSLSNEIIKDVNQKLASLEDSLKGLQVTRIKFKI